MQLTNPKTNTQEILLTLIQKGKVSIMDYSYMSGFRTRISNIKNDLGLELEQVYKSKKNKFGNTYSYVEHILKDKQKAIEIYKKIS
jgi:hypothetical protein